MLLDLWLNEVWVAKDMHLYLCVCIHVIARVRQIVCLKSHRKSYLKTGSETEGERFGSMSKLVHIWVCVCIQMCVLDLAVSVCTNGCSL